MGAVQLCHTSDQMALEDTVKIAWPRTGLDSVNATFSTVGTAGAKDRVGDQMRPGEPLRPGGRCPMTPRRNPTQLGVGGMEKGPAPAPSRT